MRIRGNLRAVQSDIVMQRFEILPGLPAYGPMYISITESSEPFYSEGFVVKFYKADGGYWVGNFKPGWTSFNKAFELYGSPNVLVIAGGICYLIDPENATKIDTFGDGCASAITTPLNQVVFANTRHIIVAEPTGEIWQSERVSWDGITDLHVTNNVVTGTAFDPLDFDPDKGEEPWIEFSVNLSTREVIGGSYGKYSFEPVTRGEARVALGKKKPWWKFW
jgi:hypothetical protein